MRLIDADALKEDLRRYFTDGVLDGVSARLAFNQILHDIDNAPTVAEIFKSGSAVAVRPIGGQVVPDNLQGWRYEEEPQGDLIKRNLAITYAKSGLVRRIDGEDWIRVSEVVQSLKDVPTVDIPCNDCCADTYRDGYEKGKTDARPQGEWITHKVAFYLTCPFCGCNLRAIKRDVFEGDYDYNFCPNCGADMRGGAE